MSDEQKKVTEEPKAAAEDPRPKARKHRSRHEGGKGKKGGGMATKVVATVFGAVVAPILVMGGHYGTAHEEVIARGVIPVVHDAGQVDAFARLAQKRSGLGRAEKRRGGAPVGRLWAVERAQWCSDTRAALPKRPAVRELLPTLV